MAYGLHQVRRQGSSLAAMTHRLRRRRHLLLHERGRFGSASAAVAVAHPRLGEEIELDALLPLHVGRVRQVVALR